MDRPQINLFDRFIDWLFWMLDFTPGSPQEEEWPSDWPEE